MKYRIILIYVFLSIFKCLSSQNICDVKVTCQYKDSGILYILLVDNETFKVPLKYICKKKIEVMNNNDLDSTEVIFKNIAPGYYGVRCFIDKNNNGKVDRGPFGPKEPWGMSWNTSRKKMIPSFDQIKFLIEDDFDFPKIIIEK